MIEVLNNNNNNTTIILVDEYDASITKQIYNPSFKDNREILIE